MNQYLSLGRVRNMSFDDEKLFKILCFYPQTSEEVDYLISDGFMTRKYEFTGKATVYRKEFIKSKRQVILDTIRSQGSYLANGDHVLELSGLHDLTVLEIILEVLSEKGLLKKLENGDYIAVNTN